MPGKNANGEGSIIKRADGRYMARVTLPDGRRKCFYAATREDARKLLTRALGDRDRGMPIVAENQTVRQFLVGDTKPGGEGYPGGWLGGIKAAVAPKTLTGHEDYIRLHILPTLGGVSLSRLSPQQVQALYSKKVAGGLSPTTVNHLHAVLHKALDQAMRWNLVGRNVADLVHPPRVAHPEMATLSAEQAKALLEAAGGDRLRALYVLALFTGMRQGEILGLRWRDVALEAGTVQVRATMQRVRKDSISNGATVKDSATRGAAISGLALKEPKTAKSRRQIALAPMAVAALRNHRAKQAEERLQAGPAWEDWDLVFCNLHGRPIEATNLLRRSFKPLLERASLPAIRFHDLRHTAATICLRKKVPAKVVSEMLGHSQVGITLNIYSHVLPDMQKDATAAMEAALWG